ncbi:MAG: hypothetical protein WCE79_04055 [Xanthobacteraceae bacterium]
MRGITIRLAQTKGGIRDGGADAGQPQSAHLCSAYDTKWKPQSNFYASLLYLSSEEDSVMLSQFAHIVAKLASMLFRPTLGTGVYRPEKYYMRGPGPQWHAKHDRVR